MQLLCTVGSCGQTVSPPANMPAKQICVHDEEELAWLLLSILMSVLVWLWPDDRDRYAARCAWKVIAFWMSMEQKCVGATI